MAGIYNHSIKSRRFKDVIQGFPIGCSALHGDHFTAATQKPVSQSKKLPGCCTKLTYFLLAATFKAGYNEFFVHIDTTTIVVNFFHNRHLLKKFTARLSVCYHFTVRPFAMTLVH